MHIQKIFCQDSACTCAARGARSGRTYPNWDGEDQTRVISVTGDELTIISPVSAVGDGTVHLALRRVK